MPYDYSHRPVSVAGKTAVVIGGTSGIGRAIALGFAADGADVVATSRTEATVERTADELRERGARTHALTCDVTDRDSLVALREQTVEEFGGVDVLVNSPSAIARRSVTAVTESEFDHVLDVQLKGPLRATQVFAEDMDEGAIVNISSASAISALPNLVAYSCAKAATDALTRVSAEELGPEIRVNAIRPGFVVTEQTEDTYVEGDPRYETIRSRTTNGRLARPAEVVGAAVYLASEAASYTTGEILTVDDGFLSATFAD